MARKKRIKSCPLGAPIFLLTYADMVTLLLTFFVMLFTVAKVDGKELRIILSAFRGSLGFFEGGQTLSKGKLEQMGMNLMSLPAPEKEKTLSQALSVATEIFEPEVQSKKITVTQDERGLVISLIGNDHFPPGSARLTDESKRILKKVGGFLRQNSSFIRIEGHSDESGLVNTPAGERYATNWELSSQRSINVLRFLHESEDVEPSKMSAVSFAQYRPVSDSQTPEGRALNRRVDIVILTNKSAVRDYDENDVPGNKYPGIEWENP
ncbi:MAG: OmpA family protein [Leptospirales bacterium]